MAEKDQEPTALNVENEKGTSIHDDAERHASVYSAQVKVSDFKADAIEAENAEHNMTVLQAVRAYPMASFWAFVMSAMIVSRWEPEVWVRRGVVLINCRSWSPTMCSWRTTFSLFMLSRGISVHIRLISGGTSHQGGRQPSRALVNWEP